MTYMGRKMHLVKRADGGIAVAGITVWFRASETGCFLQIDSLSRTDAPFASLSQSAANIGVGYASITSNSSPSVTPSSGSLMVIAREPSNCYSRNMGTVLLKTGRRVGSACGTEIVRQGDDNKSEKRKGNTRT